MVTSPLRIGILALQGAVIPHEQKLKALGAIPVEVRVPEDLEGLDGIILPGGESTTMLHLLRLNRLWEPLSAFVRTKPAWGVCAGAILLAREVSSPAQPSLAALDIAVSRNAYGRQIHSFIDQLTPTPEWPNHEHLEGVFIRAPKFTRVFGDTRVLLKWKDEPVMVEEGLLMASSFHPELTESTAIHRYFLDKCRRDH